MTDEDEQKDDLRKIEMAGFHALRKPVARRRVGLSFDFDGWDELARNGRQKKDDDQS